MIRIIILSLVLFTCAALSQEQDDSAPQPATENIEGNSENNSANTDQTADNSVSPVIEIVDQAAEPDQANTDKNPINENEQAANPDCEAMQNCIAGVDPEKQAGVASNIMTLDLIIRVITAGGIIGALVVGIWNANTAKNALEQNRAWVLTDQSKEPGQMNTGQSPHIFTYLVRLKNFGGSPARDIKINWQFESSARDPIGNAIGSNDVGLLGPGETLNVETYQTRWGDVRAYLEKGEIIYFYISIRYSTIYKKRFGRTDFYYKLCMRNYVNEEDSKEFGWTPFSDHSGISYKIIGQLCHAV